MWPLLAELREDAPVCRMTLPNGDVGYMVTRYDDVARVLSEPIFSRARLLQPDAPRYSNGALGPPDGLLNMDPPEHSRLRRLVTKAFNARRVSRMRDHVEEITDGLLRTMTQQGAPADIMGMLCAPLPIKVICELLGVPFEDADSFRGWSETVLSVGRHTSEQQWQAEQDLRGYLLGLAGRKRAEPAEDLLSDLVSAGDQLTEHELGSLAVTLLVAGHETTVNQLGMCLFLLLRQPSWYDELRADPTRVPGTVEELLRLYPAVTGCAPRMATKDVEIGGVHVPAGSVLLVSTLAANLDPDVFDDAETLTHGRTGSSHFTFGHGPHYCLGAALARIELQVVIEMLLARLPGLRLAVRPADVKWRTGQLIVGVEELPVTW